MRIKAGDKVIVISGKDKGKIGTVLKTFQKDNKVMVEGVNIRKKHVAPTQQDQDGGIKEFQAPFDVSKVMYYDDSAKTGSRIGYKFEGDKKVRYAKKSGNTID